MFEKALRMKLRFDTDKGSISTEDLFDLPLTSTRGICLDTVAKGLNRKLKDSDEESFVTESTPANTTLKLKLDIVKYVISVKKMENEVVRISAEKRAQKEKIMGLIAEKQDENLKGKSLEELLAMVNSL